MNGTPSSLPSSEAIGGMINTLMSNPELMKNIMGALGSLNLNESTEDNASEPQPEEKKDETDAQVSSIPAASIPPELLSKLPLILALLNGGDSLPKSKRESDREALLCALKPYLSPRRAETLDKILRISRLGDLLGSL